MLWHTLILVDDASSHGDSVVGQVRECRGRRTVAGVGLQKEICCKMGRRKMSGRPFSRANDSLLVSFPTRVSLNRSASALAHPRHTDTRHLERVLYPLLAKKLGNWFARDQVIICYAPNCQYRRCKCLMILAIC